VGRLKALLREPLVHFLVLGAGLFLVYSLLNRSGGDDSRTIVVTRQQVESLVAGFFQTFQRPPTEAERDALIQDQVREEVYFREGTALGLDRDDPVIRARLRQKMEFLTQDVAAPADPTDDELKTYLAQNPGAFGGGPNPPAFEEIRNAVRREWMDVRRTELNEKAYLEMLARYSVRIDAPPLTASSPAH